MTLYHYILLREVFRLSLKLLEELQYGIKMVK